MKFTGPEFRENDRLGPVALFRTEDDATSEWKPREAATLVIRYLFVACGYGWEPMRAAAPPVAEAPGKARDPVD